MTFKTLAQFTPQSPNSTTLPTVAQAPLITPLATQRARLLLGSYRKIEAEDPKIFAATLAAILSRYPDDVIIAVTDPAGQYRLGWKFPPDPPEVHDACEKALEKALMPQRQAEAREAEQTRRAALIEERRQWQEAQKAIDIGRIDKAHERYRRDKAQHDLDRQDFGRAKPRWEPRPVGTIQPIGPELADDLARLMATGKPE